MGNALEIRQVNKIKPVVIDGKLVDVLVLHDISLAVQPGEVLTLLGPSGSGKSTLLRLLNRMEEPTSGQVLLDGADTSTLDVRELRRRIGMVFQVPALLPGSVADNICYGPHLRGRACAPASFLELVGLDPGLVSRPATALSVGQQQRVAIARALANEPEILLLDEPTSALDQAAARNIVDLLQRLHRELGLTVVMVTHVLEHARAVATRAALLYRGEKVADEPADSFFATPQTEMARKFIVGELTADGR